MESPEYYEAIARHYDEIFPMNPTTLAFLREQAGAAPSHVLDIACGNAAYAAALASEGYHVEGVDLDAGMLRASEEKRQEQGLAENLRLLLGDMLQLDSLGLAEPDMAFCIGNSLVHLPGQAQISTFLEKLNGLLRPNGRLVIQILNYHRILHHKLTQLPITRRSDGSVLFERLYDYDVPQAPDALRRILFHTRLHAEGMIHESRIPLIALRPEELQALLEEAGFCDIQLFGDFKRASFDPESSYTLVATAEKRSVILL